MQIPKDDPFRAEQFKHNIAVLLFHSRQFKKAVHEPQSMAELAKEIGNGCTAAWLRKIAQKGIKKPTRRNSKWLESLAKHFQLHVGDFWDTDTISLRYHSPTQKTQLPEDHPLRILYFKDNMAVLIFCSRKTMSELAKEIGNGCTAEWLRKIVHKGIKKPSRSNSKWLESLAKILQLHVADFWDTETVFFRYHSPTQKRIDGSVRRLPYHYSHS